MAGVSRNGREPSNAIFKRFRSCGYEVFPVNPAATTVEGEHCYPDLRSVPAPVDGVMIATHPNASVDIVRQCAELGINCVWFHRSIGEGSVSAEALATCRASQITPIVGGCPMMYCGQRGHLPQVHAVVAPEHRQDPGLGATGNGTPISDRNGRSTRATLDPPERRVFFNHGFHGSHGSRLS